MKTAHQQYRLLLLALCLPFGLSAQSEAEHANFTSERLLKLAESEEKIYQKIAEDPLYYSDDDLERRITTLAQSYHNYLSDNPEDAEAHILYGKLLRRMNKPNEAFTHFLKADELDPKVPVVKQQIGNHLAEAGEGEAALLYYLQAVELAPDVAIYQYGLGELLYNFGKDYIERELYTRDAIDREILKAFRKAAELEPENLDYQMRIGEAYYDQASPDWKAALLHWNKVRDASQLGIRTEIIDLHRARVMAELGRYQEAKALAETVENPALQKSRQQVLDEIALH
ncbi:MAG: tetratricopeptide repeat protein [Coraliomargarita sp.]